MNNSNQNNIQDERNKQVGKGVVDAASKSVNPYVKGAGMVAKGVDKVTGGKASKAIGKAIGRANDFNPLKTKLDRLRNSKNSGRRNLFNGGSHNGINNNQNTFRRNNGGAGALPSSGGVNTTEKTNSVVGSSTSTGSGNTSSGNNGRQNNSGGDSSFGSNLFGGRRKRKSILDMFGGSSIDEEQIGETDVSGEGKFNFRLSNPVVMFGGVIIVFVVFFLIGIQSTGLFGEFEDGLGVSYSSGGDTGNIEYETSDPDKKAFFERVSSVKNSFVASGKSFNPVLIAGFYDVMNTYGARLEYNDMGVAEIKEVAEAMFDGSMYSDDTFKQNLVSTIIPKYIDVSDDAEAEMIADKIIDYVSRYNQFIGLKEEDDICSFGSGDCTYDIKGYYIIGKGNVSEAAKVSNLYVRLMQCGTSDGHNYGGTYGQPLGGEELVPFEKYVLGVAYQEIGPSAPREAIKAQMVAARSYILARHADMGSWRTLKKEGNKWVIQAASCTADQVYCDPDKGCSSNDGQWGQIHSGLNYNTGFAKQPMPSDSPLRTYNKETSGEVLVNDSGYIIYTGYTSTEQGQFSSLADKGLDYKQILLQVYNQGSRNSGAHSVQKATCSNTAAGCGDISTGEFVNWKQRSPAWGSVPMGNSGYTIADIGCLVTSVSMQIAKSGLPTPEIKNFNPGTFVQFLNTHGGFAGGGNFIWAGATAAAPGFNYQGQIYVLGWSREAKLNKLKELVSDSHNYVVAEVKGNTGQHWVAIDAVQGDNIVMMDPGLQATDLWSTHPWYNTSTFAYYRVD